MKQSRYSYPRYIHDVVRLMYLMDYKMHNMQIQGSQGKSQCDIVHTYQLRGPRNSWVTLALAIPG
jgi:hypothetical protein